MITELEAVTERLGYRSSDLVTNASTTLSPEREQLWHEVQERFGIDAVFFQGGIPVVYFKWVPSDEVAEQLHRRLWNHDQVPLLVVVTPREVRIYDCFSPPSTPNEPPKALLASIALAANIQDWERTLEPYSRQHVMSNGHLASPAKSGRSTRVDRYLLHNLEAVRQRLLSSGLAERYVNTLLGRSIMIRYLEDRGILRPAYIRQFGSADSYLNLLSVSRAASYELFRELNAKFNGDMFEVTADEHASVQSEHLQELSSFFSGTHLATGQSYFWAYDFESIPIDLISAIYEDFLREGRKSSGAYYTPPEIVRFVVGQTMPIDAELSSVFDPACGSGVFLVEAFRRIVFNWRRQHNFERPDFATLRNLLTSHIFGVDINPEAIRVAAFSCYLAMLDLVEPKSVWHHARFPSLVGTNLFAMDFFDRAADFNDRRYDLIIGNPPWRSALGPLAETYVKETGRPIGDRQLAQAFAWRAMDLLSRDGRLGLLLPSKSFLYNSSSRNNLFRKAFFKEAQLDQVVDFSLFHQDLFEDSQGPMAAVFCRTRAEGTSTEAHAVTYYGPHPSPLAKSVAGVVVAGDEIKSLASQATQMKPFAWKVCLWGTPRDLAFITRLREEFLSLQTVAEKRGWILHEGLQKKGTGRMHAPELNELPFIPVEALEPFRAVADMSLRVGQVDFHRTADLAIYKAPHLLIRRGPIRRRKVAAAYLENDAVFTHSVVGLAATPMDSSWLRGLSALLNSSFAQYYLFLTSVSWGIERGEIELQDYRGFPLPDFGSAPELFVRLIHVEERCRRHGSTGDDMKELDDIVYSLYGLAKSERQLVDDVIRFGIEQYAARAPSEPYRPPEPNELEMYARSVIEVLSATVGSSDSRLTGTVYDGNAPYRVVSINIEAQRGEAGSPIRVSSNTDLDSLLRTLDPPQDEARAVGLWLRRNSTILFRDSVHIIKPAELRFWSKSVAYNDADLVVRDVLRSRPVSV